MNFKLQKVTIIVLEYHNRPVVYSLTYLTFYGEMIGGHVLFDIANDVMNVAHF
jgi:hypothetical protein